MSPSGNDNNDFQSYKLLILDNFKRCFEDIKDLQTRVSDLEKRVLILTIGLFAGREVVVAGFPGIKDLLLASGGAN